MNSETGTKNKIFSTYELQQYKIYTVIFLTTYFKSTQISATALSPNVSWYLTTFSLIWKLSIIHGYQDQDEEWKQCAQSLKYLVSHSNRWKHSLEGRVNEWSQCEIMIFPKVSVYDRQHWITRLKMPLLRTILVNYSLISCGSFFREWASWLTVSSRLHGMNGFLGRKQRKRNGMWAIRSSQMPTWLSIKAIAGLSLPLECCFRSRDFKGVGLRLML